LYRFQNSKFINLSFSLTEQNFLGRRKILSFDFDMNQSQIALGPSYIDRNLLGRRLRLSASVSSIYSRDALFDSGKFASEGTQSDIQLSRPLWSLASKWGASVAFSHRFSIDRSFKGTSLRTFDVPETPEDDVLPWQYKQRKINTTAALQRQFGTDIKHRFTLGHSFELQRPSVLPDFAGTDAQRASFIDGVLPRSEQNSVLFGTYNIFTPNYRTLHNIETLDLAEDYQMGPNLSATLGVAPTWLGSSALFIRSKLDATWIWPVPRRIHSSFCWQFSSLAARTFHRQHSIGHIACGCAVKFHRQNYRARPCTDSLERYSKSIQCYWVRERAAWF
jgi:hypothetical protein